MWKWLKDFFAGPIIYDADNPEAYDPFMDLLYRYGQLQAENADLRSVVRSLQNECAELRRDLHTNTTHLIARNNALANLASERDALQSTLSVYEEDDCA